jgi:predicted metalloprotease
VWHEQFAQRGLEYREPTLVLFRERVDSACGLASSAVGPFYCPSDGKLYLDLGFLDELRTRLGAPGDFAQAYVIAHEVGHHVQNLLGIADQVSAQRSADPGRASELSVRLELQADYFAGCWAHHAERMRHILEQGDLEEALNAASRIGDDVLQRRAQGRVTPDSFTHGTAAQRVRWLRRGLESGRIEDGRHVRGATALTQGEPARSTGAGVRPQPRAHRREHPGHEAAQRRGSRAGRP